MNISIINYPFYKFRIFKYKFKGGPYIFLRRLTDVFENEVDLKIKPFFLKNDLTLYLGGKTINNNKKYLLRLDGVNIDVRDRLRIQKHKIIEDNIKNCSGIIFHSEYCKLIHEKFFNLKEKKIKIIHNGVPLQQFTKYGNNLREKIKYNSNDFVIICSARWTRRHKRLIEIIEFFNILKHNEDKLSLKLLVLGEVPKNLNIKDNDIYFAGDIDVKNLPEWYRTANLFIHLAWIEPSGNAHLEAIACGLPVLCVNNGGLKETIKLTKSGIISHADKNYNYELVDYYNPPKPNYSILMEDFKKILTNYEEIKKSIDLSPIDIRNTAKQYKNFINEIYNQKK